MPPEEQLSLFSQDTANSIAELNTNNFDLIPTSSKMAIPPHTYTSISQIAAHCRECHRCGLGDTRINAVVGRGNEHAPILIVGEGPGQNEDEQASVRLSIDRDIYISNVVRCRPPDNRIPTTAEIAACKPYLLEQIRLLNPKIILLAGVTAVKAVTAKKDAIGKIRGTWIEWEGRWCMPIFHPAYLLRTPEPDVGKPKWLMWQDIQAVRAKLEELG
jgi:uracil-DNA glycosylase